MRTTKLELWCTWLASLLVVCSACSTVKVHVRSDGQRPPGGYLLLFLDEEQRDKFVALKEQDDTLDDWINYTGKKPEELIGKIPQERLRMGELDETAPDPFLVKGDKGIHEADWMLIFVADGSEKLSTSNHLLKRRKKLVSWPYWSNGAITASTDRIYIGSPNSSGKGTQ